MLFLFLCFSGFILVIIVPLACLQQIQDNNVPRLKSSTKNEGKNHNSTDDMYGFINDLVKRSTTDNRKRILPTRQINRNSEVSYQESTPTLHELFQNHAVQKSVANKNEATSTSSRTMKEKQTDYSAAKTSQGLDAITNGAVLQLTLITGPKDKKKKSSLAHNTHSKLLPGGSSSVFISSVLLPTR